MKKLFSVLFMTLVVLLVGCTKEVVISFESEFGAASDKTIKEGESVILPELNKTGYDLVGWFTDSEYKNEYTGGELTENTTLYAKWEIKKYTVKFISEETVVDTQTVEHGKDAVLPADPVKEGFDFTGWDKGASAVTSDLEINALFEETKYNVVFKVDDVEVKKVSVKKGETVTAPNVNEKEGFIFKGWDKDFSSITSDLEINAVFEVKKHTVIYMNGDNEFGKLEVEHGSYGMISTTPIKEGYTFVRWDIEEKLESVVEDLTANAIFEKTSFLVKFFADSNEIDSQYVAKGEEAIAPKAPEKEGYTFKSWDKEFDDVQDDMNITAIYEINKYKVTYMVDGTIYGQVSEVEHGNGAVLPQEPSVEGYTFIGWDKELTNIKSNTIVNALLEAKEYTIKYFDGTVELTGMSPEKYTIKDSLDLPVQTKTGFIFAGWFVDNDFTKSAIFGLDEGKTGNLNLYAGYVEVDLNGGKMSWTSTAVTNPGAGIDAVSDLPEMFEYDFFTYLKDNNLLNSSLINSALRVTTFAQFSAVNPLHNSDPKRIWNDTSTNTSSGADGYVAVFLFETVVCDSNGNLVDVNGGFLGTEPYKTKYFNLLSSLALMQKYKGETGNYTALDANTNSTRALCAFIIDGYFYGTQGAADSYFKELRSVVPTTTTKYKLSGTTILAVTTEYVYTTSKTGTIDALAVPFREGYFFTGWYSDSACTTKLTNETIVNNSKIYAGWVQIS